MDDDRSRTLRRRLQNRHRSRSDVRTWFDYDSEEWVVAIDATEVRAPTLAEASSSAAEILDRNERQPHH